MAIEVEDGTGKSNAVAYVSVATADSYHAERGNTKWTDVSVTTTLKEQAIIRATSYIDKRFQARFIGYKSTATQSLEWPRASAYDTNGFSLVGTVPVLLARACCEYALRAVLYNVLAPDPVSPVPTQNMTFGASSGSSVTGGEMIKNKIVVGPIEIEKEYQAQSGNLSSNSWSKSGVVDGWKLPEYPEADLWIEQLLGPRKAYLSRM